MTERIDPKDLVSALPLDKPAPTRMTRRDKLLRFAELVRNTPAYLALFHSLEHCQNLWESLAHDSMGASAFTVALRDPVLREQGYTGRTIRDAANFFELSAADLHEFSCNCGGSISNAQMAERIENIANGIRTRHNEPQQTTITLSPPRMSFFRSIFNL